MVTLWFYRPRGIVERTSAFLTKRLWSRVAINHDVVNVRVLTESCPRRGSWCAPISSARTPDRMVPLLGMDDDWVTAWLVKRWGVTFGALDRVFSSSTVCGPTEDGKVHTSVMAASLLCEAEREGFPVPLRRGVRIVNPRAVDADALYRSVRLPDGWDTEPL